MTTPRTESAMSAAFARAGMNTAEFRMRQAAHDALAKHHNNIGRALPTFKKLLDKETNDAALLFVLKELSAWDQNEVGHQSADVPSRQPNGDGRGHIARDNQALSAASPPRDGAGHSSVVNHRPGARPVREPYLPGRSTRGLASIVATQRTMRSGLLFLTKTSDGRAWGDVGWHELDGMDRDGAIARIIKRKFGLPANRFVTLAEHMTDTQFLGVINEAKQQNDPA